MTRNLREKMGLLNLLKTTKKNVVGKIKRNQRAKKIMDASLRSRDYWDTSLSQCLTMEIGHVLCHTLLQEYDIDPKFDALMMMYNDKTESSEYPIVSGVGFFWQTMFSDIHDVKAKGDEYKIPFLIAHKEISEVNKGDINGIIFDYIHSCQGIANIEGRVDEDVAHFTKTYVGRSNDSLHLNYVGEKDKSGSTERTDMPVIGKGVDRYAGAWSWQNIPKKDLDLNGWGDGTFVLYMFREPESLDSIVASGKK